MKPALALVCSLVLLAALVWLVFGNSGRDEALDQDWELRVEAFDPEDAATATLEGSRADVGTGTRGPRGYPPGRDPMKPRVTRTGTLEVLPVGPDGTTIHADLVTVRVSSRHAVFGGVHGLRDRETGLWTFEDVPIGEAQIIVFGDHIVDRQERAVIREGVSTHQKVSVMRGAMVHYQVELDDGTAPERVTLELTGEDGRAASARWQVRMPTAFSTAHRAASITQGPDGYVFAIRPGSYKLTARLPTGEHDQADLVLAADERAEVRLLLRR